MLAIFRIEILSLTFKGSEGESGDAAAWEIPGLLHGTAVRVLEVGRGG